MGRALLILSGLVAAGWYLLVNHSARTVYSCRGELTSTGVSQPETVLFAIDRSNWWIIGANDDGDAYIEDSDGNQVYYSGVDESLNQLFLYRGTASQGIPHGIFSTLSNYLRFRHGKDIFFDGTCTEKV